MKIIETNFSFQITTPENFTFKLVGKLIHSPEVEDVQLLEVEQITIDDKPASRLFKAFDSSLHEELFGILKECVMKDVARQQSEGTFNPLHVVEASTRLQ